ncbi:MAG TPA: signal peptidase I [Erysipelotrichaceae bacterium]|nr:signal peptidase I [Erysipelotrichaceae bacterium]
MSEKDHYRPTADEISQEITAGKRRRTFFRTLRSTAFAMLSVAAVAILIATQLLPTLRIFGSSMSPTLEEGEIVVAVKTSKFKTGDIAAFYYNNKLLVKRVICGPGEWFNLQEDGTVYVNGIRLEEPYLTEKHMGSCDLELPYQVPEQQYFMIGDDRESSVDSRLKQVGCIPEEQIVGKIFFRIWPLSAFGKVS